MGLPIRVEGNDVELTLVHPVYITKRVEPEDGSEPYDESILKKEIKVRRWFTKDSIVSVQEFVTQQNRIAKKRCLVYDKYTNQFYACYHSVQNVRSAIKSTKNQIGFHKTN